MNGIEIRRVGYATPDAQALIRAALDDLRERYGDGDGDGTPVDPAEFEPPDGAFLVAYLDGAPVACVGWRSVGDDGLVAEIKRMYTAAQARGRGLGRTMLAEAERAARESGRRRMILETGDRQPEAIRLYESAGYRRIADFGFYRNEPGVLSFGRDLEAP